jgi:ribulose-phosphate 3-epimerase
MDGLFAPNITFGPGAVRAIRKVVNLPLDCHLMISEPVRYCEKFLEAGGDYITVHAETLNGQELKEISDSVKKHRKQLGVAFKPETPLSSLGLVGMDVSLITIMSVNPGFSGQKFMPEVLPKILEAQSGRFVDTSDVDIEVDGGVGKENVRELVEMGASVLVTGSSVLGQPDPKRAIEELRGIIDNGARN